jgi:integrative and conjugative element protein (TIGR02256 family)
VSAALSTGQVLAVDQLRELEASSGGAVELLGAPRRDAADAPATIRISLDCAGAATGGPGIVLRAREDFEIDIPGDFPFAPPHVRVRHERWAGTPHVQFGKHLCLYVAPSVEWAPGDGMRGLVERLGLWLSRAATGELDPDDQPLHPPVAYTSLAADIIVPRADVPGWALPPTGADSEPLLLVAVCVQAREGRVDIVEWVSAEQWAARFQTAELTAGLDEAGRRTLGAAAILLGRDIGFEFPDKAADLIDGLDRTGADTSRLLQLLGEVSKFNTRLDTASAEAAFPPRPLQLLVGTPSRRSQHEGRRLVHMVCWKLDSDSRELLTAASHGASAWAAAKESWSGQEAAGWVRVVEDRPEVTRRRDQDSSASWLTGKSILIIGCGALGAPVAEQCVRAGVTRVDLADNGLVTPGILTRQPYSDADIGRFKSEVLAERLNQIDQIAGGKRVASLPGNALNTVLNNRLQPSAYDLIIDAAADSAVTSRLELLRTELPGPWPPIVTMLIGHRARLGVLALGRPEATGAGRDILRKLGVAVCGAQNGAFADVADDIFPAQPRTRLFHPEPGCSAPTFIGSASEVTALASHLLTAGLDALAGRTTGPAAHPLAAAVVRLDPNTAGTRWLGWPNDLVIGETSGLQIRISPVAIREMKAESRRGARLRGPDVETGGMLLGEIDEACSCVWVDIATGPPPDSRLSAARFDHGIQGAAELLAYHRERSRHITGFTGMWHTHPHQPAQPSTQDKAGMQQVLNRPGEPGTSPRALMLILGGNQKTWQEWLDHAEVPEQYAHLVRRDPTNPPTQPDTSDGHGTATVFPGGYALHFPSNPVAPARPGRWARLRAHLHTRREKPAS